MTVRFDDVTALGPGDDVYPPAFMAPRSCCRDHRSLDISTKAPIQLHDGFDDAVQFQRQRFVAFTQRSAFQFQWQAFFFQCVGVGQGGVEEQLIACFLERQQGVVGEVVGKGFA